MRKRLKIVSLLTALALLGGLLGGCGKSSRIETDSVAVQETTDPLLAEHQKQLEQLNSSYTKRLTSNSQGVEFHLYYDDTQSMLGFVEAANGQNTFVTMLDKSIDCAKGMLNNGFSALKAYTLVDEIPGDKKNQELNWTEVDIVGALQAQFLRSDFYTGSHTGHREGTLTHAGTGTKVGPLARLFLDGNDPFVKGTFTVVVTDLREQGFDLDDLVNGLLSYREAEPGAEICIVGCISDYTGELSVPAYSNSNAGADIASIDNYDGPAAYYYIMAGPTEQMDQYIGMLQDNMQDENLVYATFEELAASEGKPLSFSREKYHGGKAHGRFATGKCFRQWENHARDGAGGRTAGVFGPRHQKKNPWYGSRNDEYCRHTAAGGKDGSKQDRNGAGKASSLQGSCRKPDGKPVY